MKRRFPIVKKYPILYPFSHFARWIQLIKRRGVKGNTDILQHQLDLSKTQAPQIGDLLGKLELEVKSEEKLGKPKIKQK